jgi:uncharacterized protein (DUF1330 family)
MKRAYWINFMRELRDAEKLKAYADLATPAIAAAGGKFIARGMPAFVLESGLNERTVIIEFPSVEAARACYESAPYRRALEALGDGAVRDLRIIEAAD